MSLKRNKIHIVDIFVLKLKQKVKSIAIDPRVVQFIYMTIF